MAKTKVNLLSLLQSQIDAGKTMVSIDGDIVSPNEADTLFRKEYKNLIKNDEINMEDISFSDYKKERLEEYFDTSYFINLFSVDEDSETEESEK